MISSLRMRPAVMSRLLLLAAFSQGVCCTTHEKPDPAPDPGGEEAAGIDPRAAAVLRDVARYFRERGSLRVEVATLGRFTGRGEVDERRGFAYVKARRPDKLSLTYVDQGRVDTIVYDGTRSHLHIASEGAHVVEEARGTIEEFLAGASLGARVFNAHSHVAGYLLRDDCYGMLAREASDIRYLGIEKDGGVDCHRLKLTVPDQGVVHVWIDAGEAPLVRKLAPDVSTMPGAKDAGQEEREFSTVLSDWSLDADLPDSSFVFIPPEGSRKVESLDEVEVGATHPLVGRRAPDSKLPLLDGGELEPAALRDGRLIVLYFWSAWCEPCRRALPVLAEITARFGQRNVAFCAVNVGDRAEVVRSFLADLDVQCQVALDPDGRVARRYGASAVPQTVIVGADGVIQAVEVGTTDGPGKAAMLRLGLLLGGESILPETGPGAERKGQGRDAHGQRISR